jgi:hypothetical protein
MKIGKYQLMIDDRSLSIPQRRHNVISIVTTYTPESLHFSRRLVHIHIKMFRSNILFPVAVCRHKVSVFYEFCQSCSIEPCVEYRIFSKLDRTYNTDYYKKNTGMLNNLAV